MGLGDQLLSIPKRFLLGGVLLLVVLALLLAGYYWYLPSNNPFSLSKEVKDSYAEAILLSYREKKPAEAIEKLDAEIAKINSITVKTEADLYTEAKLKVYKGDLLIGTGKPQEGIALLSGVYANTQYDLSTRNEALLVALSRSLQGLGEESLDSRDIEQWVFRDSALGVAATTTLPMNAPEPIRIYFAFIAGFSKVVGDTPSPKAYLLAESYLLRLYAQVIDYTKDVDDGYGLLNSDIEQFTSDIDLVMKQLASDNASYEEFIPTALYNLGLAHEFLSRADADARIKNIIEIRQKIIDYAGLYPDDAYRTRAFEDALGTRLVCRLIDRSGYNTKTLDTAALKPILDQLVSSAIAQKGLATPCPDQFAFVVRNIDTRFAPYVNQ